MLEIKKLNEHIDYFCVPYKDIFVGIYVIRHEGGAILFDTAATDADVDNYIAPALSQLQIPPEQVTHIFISHNHTDHAGGLSRASALFSGAQIVSRSALLKQQYPQTMCPEDGSLITDALQVITIPGHTGDCAALFDLRTMTLISGDCLQSYGIYGSGFWYGAIRLPAEHFAAVRKLRALPIETIATAHDYHPVGMISSGKDAVAARLDSCTGALDRVRAIIEAKPQLDDEQIAALCNDGTLPKVAAGVVAAMRNAVIEGHL